MHTIIKISIRNHLNRREITIIEKYIRDLIANEPFEYIIDNVEGYKVFDLEKEPENYDLNGNDKEAYLSNH